MTLTDYNAHPGISASAIKAGRASMLQMRHCMVTPRDSEAPTPAMRWGTLAHAALFEPARFAGSVAVWTGGRRAGATWAAWQADNEGKQIVTPDELSRLEAMQAAVRANRDARLFMSRVEVVETPMTWTRPDIGQCKGRPDCLGDRWIGDFKTARDISQRRLFSQFAALGYAHQLAWYRDGFELISKQQVQACWILIQQSVPPYECGVIGMPLSLLDAAMGDSGGDPHADTCLAIARHYRACEAAQSWPGRYDGIITYEPPVRAGGVETETDISTGEMGASEL